VLALLYELGLSRIPGLGESLNDLAAAATWAGAPLRWASLSPFYPSPTSSPEHSTTPRSAAYPEHWTMRRPFARTVRVGPGRHLLDGLRSADVAQPGAHRTAL
jgi:hypothetical protein